MASMASKKRKSHKQRKGRKRKGGAAFVASSGCEAFEGEDEQFKPPHCQSEEYKASLKKGGKKRKSRKGRKSRRRKSRRRRKSHGRKSRRRR